MDLGAPVKPALRAADERSGVSVISGIKGSAIESVIDDLNRLVDEGRMARDDLEVRLEAEDLRLLDEKVLAALWYPLDSWERLSRILLEVEGGGDPEYLVQRGRNAAERLKAMGLYAQLQGDREFWGDRMGAMLSTLGPTMYKGTDWRIEAEPGELQHFRVEARVSPEFPDLGMHPIQGFIDYMANDQLGLGVELCARRASPTLLEFLARPA